MFYQTEITLFGRTSRLNHASRADALAHCYFLEYSVGIPCRVIPRSGL